MTRGRKILRGLLALLLLLVLVFLLFRNYALNKFINRFSEKLEREYALMLNVGHASFSGIATVNMEGVTVLPMQGDTLIRLDSLSASPSLSSLLLFNLKLKSLHMKHGFLR